MRRLTLKIPAVFTVGLLGALLVWMAAPLAGQTAPRLWAAQTGPDEVTLSWDAIPGTSEYLIYAAPVDSVTGNLRMRPALRRLTATSHGSTIYGIRQLTGGITLVAMAANGHVIEKAAFNAITPATSFSPIQPPEEITAEASGPTEITLSWTPVPGATAYYIGRAVTPSGYKPLCAICPAEPRYVDRDVLSGAGHRYVVAAIFPNGRSRPAPSNDVTPGVTQVASGTPAGTPPAPAAVTSGSLAGTPLGSAATTTPPATSTPSLVNPQIPATVPPTAPPPIGPAPSGASSLMTPPADTGSCIVRTADTSTAADTTERIDLRAARIDARATQNPDAPTTSVSTPAFTTTTNFGSSDYQQGKCLNPGVIGYPDLWDPVATASGMTSAERIAAWKELEIVALEYKHILGRQPTPEETRRDVAALKAGRTWKQLWRQLAHSAERDTRFGYWAAAPIPDSSQAKQDFETAVAPWTSQQCFGGLGPKCDGGIPEVINIKVSPIWFGAFRMPDNTELAYVEIGVAVGSILHDNACLKDRGGLNCDGMGAGDLIKIGGLWGAALEWNKAAWNVIDQRTWRQTFGPYPTNPQIRNLDWYDDLRPAAPRPAMMAPAISMLTWPGLTVSPTDGETRQSRALLAPAGTSLDDTDVAFCRSGAFGQTGWFAGKASWGICK